MSIRSHPAEMRSAPQAHAAESAAQETAVTFVIGLIGPALAQLYLKMLSEGVVQSGFFALTRYMKLDSRVV